MNSEEVWRDIPGLSGYQVSDLGRVRSLDRSITHSDGVVTRRRGRVMHLKILPQGYLGVKLAGRYCRVHRLVMLAFVGVPPEGHEVAHGNGVRADSRLTNLRYATKAENEADKIAHGTAAVGESHGCARLTEAVVLDIRAAAGGLKLAELARDFGISRTQAHRIVTGDAWAHVDGSTRPTKSRAKLSAECAAEIRRLAGVHTGAELARRFGVAPAQVSRVLSGKAWVDRSGQAPQLRAP